MLYILIFLLSNILLSINSGKVYINPNASCYYSCSGSSDDPFNGIWQAFQSFNSDTEFILLNNETSPQILIASEHTEPNGDLLSADPRVSLSGNIILRPLYCDDDDAINDPYLEGACISRNQSLRLYIKTADIRIIVDGSLTVQNIIFSGVEVMTHFTDPNDIEPCGAYRELCCADL